MRRLAPIVAASPSGRHPSPGLVSSSLIRLGKVAPARSPRSSARRAHCQHRRVASPDATSAVWFLDSAANVGEVTGGMDAGVIAFVHSTGDVATYRPVGAPADALRASTESLE